MWLLLGLTEAVTGDDGMLRRPVKPAVTVDVVSF
jgi:hypothetical protein